MAILLLALTTVAPPVHTDVTVTAGPPDPTRRVVIQDDFLVPIRIPGLPAETASGGIKAPQYFAPGVAGDHGEPIAQFLAVGGYLVPNNLSANAHGNGYADPNLLIPATVEALETDGGAFDPREGNHSVHYAAVYNLRPRLAPFVSLAADSRDLDLTAGRSWLALELAYGNGFLDRLEHRRQYKVNAHRAIQSGRHNVTLLGIGYYGESMLPGLVPIDTLSFHDTIDGRQRDQTHTVLFAANDAWRRSEGTEVQLSSFIRTYNLSLYSNFGDGLIRQSEFRTSTGHQISYIHRVSSSSDLLAGIDYLREAPRRLDLDRYDELGSFRQAAANDVTLNIVSGYARLRTRIGDWLRSDISWRRDEIAVDNLDRLHPEGSFHRWTGVNSPKATLTAFSTLSLSFGQAFYTEDPRRGASVSRAHSWQVAAARSIAGTDLRITAGLVTQEQSLARIDPDTGLQYALGPSRNRFITVAAHRRFGRAAIETSFSKADARDLSGGSPVPEAPRTIFAMIGSIDRLPLNLRTRAEYDEVGRKPLGQGFTAVPVRQFRVALNRTFCEGRLETGLHVQTAAGYTGQTVESGAIVGVRIPTHATASVIWHF